MKKIMMIIFSLAFLVACGKEVVDKNGKVIDMRTSIKCYSGGEIIYENVVKGEIDDNGGPIGYYSANSWVVFKEDGSEEEMIITGDCIIRKVRF